MNPEVKAQWVAALRSGEYQQGTGALRRNDEFCCLGVLCDLHAKATGGHWFAAYYGGRRDYLPSAVVQWADLPSANPDADGRPLGNRNDGGESFEQIANLIEEHL